MSEPFYPDMETYYASKLEVFRRATANTPENIERLAKVLWKTRTKLKGFSGFPWHAIDEDDRRASRNIVKALLQEIVEMASESND